MKHQQTEKCEVSGRRIGYIRYGVFEQNTKNELEHLALDQLFVDHASGKDTERPGLRELLHNVQYGDTVMAYSLEQFACSLDHLHRLVTDMTNRGARVELLKEELVFSGGDSDRLLSLMDALVKFERALVRERQREGIALAQKRNAYRGRKKVLSTERIEELHRRAGAGEPKTILAKEFGISRGTLYQYLRRRNKTGAL